MTKEFKMKQRLKLLIQSFNTNSLAFLFLLIVMVQARDQSRTTKDVNQAQAQQLDIPNLNNPFLWDSSSLYKSNTKSKHTQLPAGRQKRSATAGGAQQQFVDACQSKMEILTPYYATNSQGKLRTVVNSELMQQAIQVETCMRSQTSQSAAKCNAQLDCGCEQKYKWHRLLVLDPRDSGVSRGLFMDWFLFPSNCVCRCKTLQTSSSKQFLRAIKRHGHE